MARRRRSGPPNPAVVLAILQQVLGLFTSLQGQVTEVKAGGTRASNAVAGIQGPLQEAVNAILKIISKK